MRRQAKLAEEFAAALEGRGVSSARRDPALAPLLSLAQGLETLPLAPAPEFRDALRRRLLAVSTVPAVELPAPTTAERARTWVEGWRVQRVMAGAAASMAVVVGASAISVGASRSVPGDALYGLKRSAEGVQLSLARNDVNRGKRHLQHAETRLHEIAKLVDTDLALAPAPADAGEITVAFGGSESERVNEALRLMDKDTRDGTRLLFEAYANERDEDVLHVVRRFTERQRDHLGQVLDKLPTAAHAKAEESLALVSNLNLRATQLLSVGTCGDNCPAPAAPVPVPGGEPVTSTPAPTPSYDSLGPIPCTCPEDPTGSPTPEPTPEPNESPTPTDSPTPSPTQTSSQPTPTSTHTHYPVPSQVPAPVASPIHTIADELNEVLPTPLPTLPPLPAVPGVDAPVVPGVPSKP